MTLSVLFASKKDGFFFFENSSAVNSIEEMKDGGKKTSGWFPVGVVQNC